MPALSFDASPVRRAVLPVGGRGTRMYPATAAVPKELLPVGTRPILEFALDEILQAGIQEIVLVTARGKSAIEDFVEDWCARQPDTIAVAYVRQPEPRGLGDAVLRARHLVCDGSFAVVLPDDVLLGSGGTLRSMIAGFARHDRAVLCVQPIDAQQTSSYGVPAIEMVEGSDWIISDLIEKPEPRDAPSALGVVGRYVLPSRIFDYLEVVGPDSRNEIQLTNALAALARHERVVGMPLRQRRIDCGNPAGFHEAQLAAGSARPGLRLNGARSHHAVVAPAVPAGTTPWKQLEPRQPASSTAAP